ncbi:hypothetical protein B296_00035612 [Ensete ventricosum]|uniref:Uncharacterized protein n=1 Tax=Ensete ventricosum TaxID=4639 RepID=A0A426Y0Q4_ENSVE|nr:hypothetical protein B296_00035612 [Ensete ventricosum]
MKVDHDLDTTVTEGSLAVITERYYIPIGYGLHVPQPGQRPYSSDAPGMCISVDALEAGLRFPLHPLIEECLRWWRISPSQSQGGYYLTARVDFRLNWAPSNNKGWKSRYLFVSGPVSRFRLNRSAHPIGNASPYLSEEESVLVDRLKGILSSSRTIKEMTELLLVEAGLSPSSRDRMDLGELRGMPKVSSGKAPPTRTATREVGSSPARETPKASSNRPVDAPVEQAADAAKRHKKIKVLMRRHKSRLGEGESRSRSKGKEPAAPSEEPDTPAESEEGDASPVHHRPRSMKDLFKTKVQKDDAGYYTLLMSDPGASRPRERDEGQMEGAEELDEGLEQLVDSGGVREGTSPPTTGAGALHAPLGGPVARATKEMVLMALFDRVHDAGRLITFMDYRIKHMQEELDALKSDRGPEAVAKAEERASELQEELEKTRQERDKALLRCEASEKELHEVQQLLKEARVRAQKMDDELLQAVKALESSRAELPK